MKNLKNVLIQRSAKIKQAIQLLDQNSMQIVLVVDEKDRLLGTITDGDIRRGILKGLTLESKVIEIMNTQPLSVRASEDKKDVIHKMRERQIRQVPLVDSVGKVVGLELIEDLLKPETHEHCAVIMAGGLGTRLGSLTDQTPKPLLTVGDKPILETIVQNLTDYGFKNFYFAVNYKADMVKSYFENGARHGVSIQYLNEEQKLGTAGALGLFAGKPTKSFVVMNGDLLTKLNFSSLIDFHETHGWDATLCVREFSFEVPYGVVRFEDQNLTRIDEKPIQRFFVNAGIYVFRPKILDFVEKNQFLDMPTLLNRLIEKKLKVGVFPVMEYWMDVGQLHDFQKANQDFSQYFK